MSCGRNRSGMRRARTRTRSNSSDNPVAQTEAEDGPSKHSSQFASDQQVERLMGDVFGDLQFLLDNFERMKLIVAPEASRAGGGVEFKVNRLHSFISHLRLIMAHIRAARSLHSPLTIAQLDLLEQHIITSILPVKERLLRQIYPAGVAAFRPSEADGTGNSGDDSDQAQSFVSAESERCTEDDSGRRNSSTSSGTGCKSDNLEWREDHSGELPMRRNITGSLRKDSGLNHENNEANDFRVGIGHIGHIGQDQTRSKMRETERLAEGLSGAGASSSVHYGDDRCADVEGMPRLARQPRQNLLHLLDELEIEDVFDADGRCPSRYTGLSRDQPPLFDPDEPSSTRDGSVESCDEQRRSTEAAGGGCIPPWSASVSRETSGGEAPLRHFVLASDAREPLAVCEVRDTRVDGISGPSNLDAAKSLGVSRLKSERPGVGVASLGTGQRTKRIDASGRGNAPRSWSAARHAEDDQFASPTSVCAGRSQAESTTDGGVDADTHPVLDIMPRCVTLGSPRPAKLRRSSQRLAPSTAPRHSCCLPRGQACPTSSNVHISDAETQPFVPMKNLEHIAVLTETSTKVRRECAGCDGTCEEGDGETSDDHSEDDSSTDEAHGLDAWDPRELMDVDEGAGAVTLDSEQAAKLLVLMCHARRCSGQHCSPRLAEVCRSVKVLMLHLRDCNGETATGNPCPMSWCKPCRSLLHHLAQCEDPTRCQICNSPHLRSPLRDPCALNTRDRPDDTIQNPRYEDVAIAARGYHGAGGGGDTAAATAATQDPSDTSVRSHDAPTPT